MKRVLVGGMSHESNSFSPIIAYEKDFSVISIKQIAVKGYILRLKPLYPV